MTSHTVALYLMTSRGLAVLQGLLDRIGPGALRCVVSVRDPGTLDDGFDAIQDMARAAGIPFFERAEAPPDGGHGLLVAWRWLIDPFERVVVLHDSLLPRYRGFAPLVTSLLNAEPEIGVTAVWAAREFDAGPVIGRRRIAITYPLTIREALARLQPLYQELAVEIVEAIVAGATLPAQAQDDRAATYSLWRDEEDYWMDWTRDAGFLRRFVDALGYPYRGAKSRLNGAVVSVLAVEEVPDVVVEIRQPGKVLFVRAGCPVVVCGQGLLLIRRLVDRSTGESRLPLTRFRSRFG